jgi:hypothetical protein
MKKWAHELNGIFKGRVTKVRKYMKKFSTSLAIKELQIKTTVIFHFTPGRMSIFKDNNNHEC